MKENYPEINGIYKHYKGGVYKVLFLSRHTERDEILVNYKSLQFGSFHSRPLSEWNKPTIIPGEEFRFTLIQKPDFCEPLV